MAVAKNHKTCIGMAVCRQDRAYKDYTSNPIPTSIFFAVLSLHYEITGNNTDVEEKGYRDGATFVVFV